MCLPLQLSPRPAILRRGLLLGILRRKVIRAIDTLLLTGEPKPPLNEVIAAHVQSLAGAISATTDRAWLSVAAARLLDE